MIESTQDDLMELNSRYNMNYINQKQIQKVQENKEEREEEIQFKQDNEHDDLDNDTLSGENEVMLENRKKNASTAFKINQRTFSSLQIFKTLIVHCNPGAFCLITILFAVLVGIGYPLR